jgi:hypothetical protein
METSEVEETLEAEEASTLTGDIYNVSFVRTWDT